LNKADSLKSETFFLSVKKPPLLDIGDSIADDMRLILDSLERSLEVVG
jgi:hypothetical protein